MVSQLYPWLLSNSLFTYCCHIEILLAQQKQFIPQCWQRIQSIDQYQKWYCFQLIEYYMIFIRYSQILYRTKPWYLLKYPHIVRLPTEYRLTTYWWSSIFVIDLFLAAVTAIWMDYLFKWIRSISYYGWTFFKTDTTLCMLMTTIYWFLIGESI